MLLDRSKWPAHRPWAVAVALITLGAGVWFALEARESPDWPGGSSAVGISLGVLGGGIILFEFAYWLRKKVRAWPIGSADAWLRSHIWLGLLCLPLLVLHSGLRLGGLLTTALMVLLVVVVVSGIFGLVLQNVLPRRRFDDLPGETVYAQRELLAGRLVAEADRLVGAMCGASAIGAERALLQRGEPFLAIGSGRVIHMEPSDHPIAEAESLADFYREQVAPFLLNGGAGRSTLANVGDAARLFHDCKARLPLEAHALVDTLERFCQERRLWDRQVRVHFWLHSWLWVHFPLSVALLVLMFVHAVVALRYVQVNVIMTAHPADNAALRPPLDVHRRIEPILRWKVRLGYVALLGTLTCLAGTYAWTGRTDFQAERGPVSAVHQAWESNCQACHVDFTPISSRSWTASFLGDPAQSTQRCETCHAGPIHHAGAHPDLTCGTCHREHRGRAASLVNLPDSDCTQCHRDLNLHSGGFLHAEATVTRFSADEHPTFRSIRTDPGKLKFNHRLHLTAGMALGKGGGEIQTLGKIPARFREHYRDQQDRKEDDAPVQLQCASCHQLDAAARSPGAYMAPITYENQCQACHPLTLGAITAPHRWQPKELHGMLDNLFTAQLARGQTDFLDKKLVRPLPGKLPEVLTPTVREAIEKKVEFAEKDLYVSKRLCAECHYFAGKSVAEAIKPGIAPDLRVAPTKVPTVWLKHAKFNHKSHRAVQCAECHGAATTSETHTDVLIPDRDSCIQCHAPTTSAGTPGARFNCTECHLFHNGDNPLQGVGAARRKPANERGVTDLLSGK